METLIEAGWRVAAPWVAERELERLPARDGAEAGAGRLLMMWWPASWRPPRTTTRRRCAPSSTSWAASPRRVHETPIEDFERQFTLNLRPAYLVTAAAPPT